MHPAAKIRNVVRAIKQQWGSSETKHRLWDHEYASGRWDDCDHSPGARVYQYVEKYSPNGSILDLGCGSGNTATELNAANYAHYTGVDVSDVALGKATARSKAEGRGGKNRFIQFDITAWTPDRKYDVILFRESIYYVPGIKIKMTLDHYASYLTDKGVIIVNVGPNGTRKGRRILELIERLYSPIEKYAPSGSNEFIVVFRTSTSASSRE